MQNQDFQGDFQAWWKVVQNLLAPVLNVPASQIQQDDVYPLDPYDFFENESATPQVIVDAVQSLKNQEKT